MTKTPTQQVVTETLYRKYRPQNFGAILGQDEVVTTLQNAIKSGSIAHAYLFSGGRGTGKTSIARIFARELKTTEQDIYEIDAASNRGINEMRELRDQVAVMPFGSPYKVYIIDEVHMLTKEAFNALLKTLEEPPKHVIFVLATTEKQKVLPTILSRCQVYDFKLGMRDSLVQLVQKVAKEEEVEISEESCEYVAKLGNGSFRDTLSHLQKVFAAFGKKVEHEKLEKLFGQNNSTLELDLLEAIHYKNEEEVFTNYHKLLEADTNISALVDSLLGKVRVVILSRYSKSMQEYFAQSYSTEELEALVAFKGINSTHLKALLEAKSRILSSHMPHESFEVFLAGLFE